MCSVSKESVINSIFLSVWINEAVVYKTRVILVNLQSSPAESICLQLYRSQGSGSKENLDPAVKKIQIR